MTEAHVEGGGDWACVDGAAAEEVIDLYVVGGAWQRREVIDLCVIKGHSSLFTQNHAFILLFFPFRVETYFVVGLTKFFFPPLFIVEPNEGNPPFSLLFIPLRFFPSVFGKTKHSVHVHEYKSYNVIIFLK